jgi:hypothetical protein
VTVATWAISHAPLSLQFNSNYGTSEALVASFKRTLVQEFSGNATDCSFARAYAANLAAQGGWSAPLSQRVCALDFLLLKPLDQQRW